jgi:Zn ribbon nucleic-acid-binding protein
MGSVIDYVECPNCKQEAYNDFYYKTGEEYTNCQNCGYHYSVTIKNRDKKLNELTDQDWEVKELKNPYGCGRVKNYNSLGTAIISIENQEHFEDFKNQVLHYDNVEFASISRFIDGKIVEETVVDNGPYYDSAGFCAEDR